MKKNLLCELAAGSGMCRMVCLLMIMIMQASPNTGYAQTPTVQEQEKPVKEILTEIEQKTSVYFFYSDKDVDLSRKVALHINGQSLPSLLDQLFKNTNTTYTIDGNQVYLSSKPAQLSAKKEPTKRKKITGSIKDENGDPIVGATVVVSGTTIGTSSDINGAFVLEVTEEIGRAHV